MFYYLRNWVPGASGGLKGSLRSGVPLTGTKDGVNKVFKLPDAFAASSETVYGNGGRQVRGDDYTISGVTLTFSAGHPAPTATDTLIADYVVSS